MTLAEDFATAQALARRAFSAIRSRRASRAVLAERGPVPDDTVEAVLYFPDRLENLYQVDQWYEPMRRLAERHPVAVVTRQWETTERLLQDCPVPVHHAGSIEEVEKFLDRQRVTVVFYVNQNQQNFPVMRWADPAHVFLCHGESDKHYMSSNQLKAYDHVFIAGRAARERITRKLLGFDATRLVEVGRPQVDVHRSGPTLPDDGRTTVLYAPTTEGDVPSMRYSSAAGIGVALVRSLLATGRHRVVYRPHPRLGLTVPAFREANTEILEMVREANRADPAARHLADTDGPFGWQVDACDVCVTDVSAVAYDWLATGKPLLLTRPAEPRAELPRVGLVTEMELLDLTGAERGAELVDAAVAAGSEQHAGLVEHYFGDVTPGASMQRFLDGCETAIRQRTEGLADRAARGGPRPGPGTEAGDTP
ncbi:CDP-glycerol glycerophosphotransferase family protein [Phycicoccus sp. CSK15P-2]|uniref:CDP-glycerol glycerophosphotransferase family protein n=1 Tax=Phycicoccus sp. CSK15P-2 TaxID=2807627 RepID=UPI001951EE57|nr:CDP-glycerol glycerophosphotransferase family protein [Phycicoccus sp. CSK15P-2]MBM6405330.1 CDP-glycerol glycerophosphotransferase family protein [Phycicoccus sp. CSK15P-2]